MVHQHERGAFGDDKTISHVLLRVEVIGEGNSINVETLAEFPLVSREPSFLPPSQPEENENRHISLSATGPHVQANQGNFSCLQKFY